MPSSVALREELADNGLTGQRREGDGSDELLAGRCNDHLHFGSFLDKCTNEYSRFVAAMLPVIPNTIFFPFMFILKVLSRVV